MAHNSPKSELYSGLIRNTDLWCRNIPILNLLNLLSNLFATPEFEAMQVILLLEQLSNELSNSHHNNFFPIDQVAYLQEAERQLCTVIDSVRENGSIPTNMDIQTVLSELFGYFMTNLETNLSSIERYEVIATNGSTQNSLIFPWTNSPMPSRLSMSETPVLLPLFQRKLLNDLRREMTGLLGSALYLHQDAGSEKLNNRRLAGAIHDAFSECILRHANVISAYKLDRHDLCNRILDGASYILSPTQLLLDLGYMYRRLVGWLYELNLLHCLEQVNINVKMSTMYEDSELGIDMVLMDDNGRRVADLQISSRVNTTQTLEFWPLTEMIDFVDKHPDVKQISESFINLGEHDQLMWEANAADLLDMLMNLFTDSDFQDILYNLFEISQHKTSQLAQVDTYLQNPKELKEILRSLIQGDRTSGPHSGLGYYFFEKIFGILLHASLGKSGPVPLYLVAIGFVDPHKAITECTPAQLEDLSTTIKHLIAHATQD